MKWPNDLVLPSGVIPGEARSLQLNKLAGILVEARWSGDYLLWVAIGVGVSGVGGDIMFLEATRMPGKGSLQVTGQLGDVMKESAQIALSSVRALAPELGIDEEQFENRAFHLHVPAGAIPRTARAQGSRWPRRSRRSSPAGR